MKRRKDNLVITVAAAILVAGLLLIAIGELMRFVWFASIAVWLEGT